MTTTPLAAALYDWFTAWRDASSSWPVLSAHREREDVSREAVNVARRDDGPTPNSPVVSSSAKSREVPGDWPARDGTAFGPCERPGLSSP